MAVLCFVLLCFAQGHWFLDYFAETHSTGICCTADCCGSNIGNVMVGYNKPISLLILTVAVATLITFMWSGSSAASVYPAAKASKRLQRLLCRSFACCAVGISTFHRHLRAMASARNFYGVETVIAKPLRIVSAGVYATAKSFTVSNSPIAAKKRLPTSYYAPGSGIGLVLTDYPGRAAGKNVRIGVIGLGAGTLAAYGTTGDELRFYEINPDVIGMATPGPREMFSFISDSPARYR